MKYLKPYLKKYRKECILAPLFKCLEAVFDLLVPLVVANIINTGIAQKDTGYIVKCCALLVGMALVGLACSFTAQFFSAKAATKTATGLRHDVFAHIGSLGFPELDSIGNSTLITRMTSDINLVQNGLNLFLRLFLRSPFIVFGAVIMAFTINVRIALIFAAAVPVLSLIVFCIMKFTSRGYKNIQKNLDAVTASTRENLSGVRVIRAFGREKNEEAHFFKANEALVSKQLNVGKLSALMNPLTYVVVNICIIAILNYGAVSVGSGVLKSGEIIALVNYMSQILIELVKLANLIVTLSRAAASLGRVEQILDTGSSMKFSDNPVSFSSSREAVRFENVSLKYKGAGGESLSNISFTALKGQTIGIIGGTGSGKSSLVNLIPRFYDATGGKVLLFGEDIKSFSKEQLRSSVAVVMQKAQLFSGTIRSNLLFGNENATDEQLMEALKIAQAEDFVMKKPDGLDETVEQGGRNLSGGQRQRLTIARALVSNPEILILDDSSSALDYATDAALRKALSKLSITVFTVSQRCSGIQHADKILVLDDGILVGFGNHEQLLESCETYREIYESQFARDGHKK